MSRTLRSDDAVFGKRPAQGVDQLRTLTHQQIARPKHHRPRLLLFSLYRNEPHRRSIKETAVSIRRAGERIRRGASDPCIIAQLIRKRAPTVKRVVFETGPPSVWFYHSLRTEGLPAICIDARHAKAALDMAANKTGRE
jgi:hypothetical protein